MRTLLDPIITCPHCGVQGEYDRERIFTIRHKLDCLVWCGCCEQHLKLPVGGLCAKCEFAFAHFTTAEMDQLELIDNMDDSNAFLMEKVAVLRTKGLLDEYDY